MSPLNLGKKLKPARKAWKNFKSTLEKRLHKLKRPKSINKTTKQLGNNLAAILHSSRSLPPRLGRKGRVRARPPYALHGPNLQQALVQVKQLKLPITNKVGEKATPSAPIGRSGSSEAPTIKVTNPTMMEIKFIDMPTWSETSKDGEKGEVSCISSTYGPSVTVEELHDVDKRAEEFIAKFKEDMRLQRQRSFGEYQKMLARGSAQ